MKMKIHFEETQKIDSPNLAIQKIIQVEVEIGAGNQTATVIEIDSARSDPSMSSYSWG
jgi:hypothetical protein